jgi:hypothetical protein
MHSRNATLSVAAALAAGLTSASPAWAELDAQILAIETSVLDCSVELVFRSEDAGDYFVNMWDDGTFHAGAGGPVPADTTARVRFTIGGTINQGAAGIGFYVENGNGPAADVTYDSRGSAQAWSSELGTNCDNAGEEYGAAVVSEDFPSGSKLALKSGSKPSLSLLSKDSSVSLGRGAGSPDDPTVNGGSLRVRSQAGAFFDTTYPLDAGGWTASSSGFRFSGAGPIQSVSVTGAKSIKLKGAGGGLGHDLTTDPEAVTVELRLGERRHCMRFGGATSFVAEESFEAVGAPADDYSCPPPAP